MLYTNDEKDILINALQQQNIKLEKLKVCNDSFDHVINIKQLGKFVNVVVDDYMFKRTKVHYIEFISIKTNKGFQLKATKEELVTANFYLDKNEQLESVYVYCNIHGLYKEDIAILD